jgi:hypothetical protein
VRSRILGLATLGVVGALAVPALATDALPVWVYHDVPNGRVGVGVGFSPAHPIAHAGADIDDGQVCFGLSYQTSQCVILTEAAPAQAGAKDAPPPLVTLDYDASDGTVGFGTGVPGQPLLGARADLNSGTVCTGFSYQMPFCVQLPIH